MIAQFGLERQLYSTTEGDEDLEICVQLLQGNITQRAYIGIQLQTGIQSAQCKYHSIKLGAYCPTKTMHIYIVVFLPTVPSDVLPLNTSVLTFDVGDTQECVPIQVVDDDLLEDTESFSVSIYPISYQILVAANRSFANVLISDNEGTNNITLGLRAPNLRHQIINIV